MEDVETQVDNTNLIEEIRNAQKAPEPGSWDDSDVVHKGDEDLQSPMVRLEVKSADYVYVYDTRTAERSVVNKNMLQKQLEKKREDGSVVFTTTKPSFEPKRGTLKCLLHADNENRWLYESLGLPMCKKSNLTSPFQVKRHMQKRHHMEWEAIEEERKRMEDENKKKSDALLQRALVGSLRKSKAKKRQ